MTQAASPLRYPIPWKIGLPLLRDAILLDSRSFRADALQSIQPIANRLRIIHQENIPTEVPCLLIMNHYSRHGFGAWWIALGISAVVPKEIHWIMTDAWTHAGILGPMTRWLFPRLAKVYGFTSMPPMPPAPQDVAARAQAVRRVLEIASSKEAFIGLAPEGREIPGGILGSPPSGAGRFIYQLSKRCQRIIPIGVYEDEDHLFLSFGPPFHLETDLKMTPAERDRHGIQRVMASIACQLPRRFRGDYDPT